MSNRWSFFLFFFLSFLSVLSFTLWFTHSSPLFNPVCLAWIRERDARLVWFWWWWCSPYQRLRAYIIIIIYSYYIPGPLKLRVSSYVDSHSLLQKLLFNLTCHHDPWKIWVSFTFSHRGRLQNISVAVGSFRGSLWTLRMRRRKKSAGDPISTWGIFPLLQRHSFLPAPIK